MARVTVEDCILKVPNRFELVMMAGRRARDITAGASLSVERDNDKNPVVALREIADETVPLEQLKDSLVREHQRQIENDEPEEEIVDMMKGEEELLRRALPVEAFSAAIDDDVEEAEAVEVSEPDEPTDYEEL